MLWQVLIVHYLISIKAKLTWSITGMWMSPNYYAEASLLVGHACSSNFIQAKPFCSLHISQTASHLSRVPNLIQTACVSNKSSNQWNHIYAAPYVMNVTQWSDATQNSSDDHLFNENLPYGWICESMWKLWTLNVALNKLDPARR